MLERFMMADCYKPSAGAGGDNNRQTMVTKLIRNYRSHPLILQLPNELFYHNAMVACAPKGMPSTHVLYPINIIYLFNLSTENYELPMSWFPTPGFPMMFENIVGGISKCKPKCTSWYNKVESLRVVYYIEQLVRSGVSQRDIGVIAPYKRQVCWICTTQK